MRLAEGERLLNEHRFREARPFLTEAYELARGRGRVNADLAESLAALANSHYGLHDYDGGDRCTHDLLVALSKTAVAPSLQIALALGYRADMAFYSGNHVDAASLYEQSLQMLDRLNWQKLLKRDQQKETILRTMRYGISSTKLGKYSQAEIALKKSLDLYRQANGAREDETAIKILSAYSAALRRNGKAAPAAKIELQIKNWQISHPEKKIKIAPL